MITQLHISNLAVIEDVTLEFPTRYVSLIGKTGAGKSLIVNSLSLLKGDKADFSLIRDPKEKAIVSAYFEISPEFLSLHEELSPYVEEGGIVLKRVLNYEKNSRYYINGDLFALSEYRQIVKPLIDIHSQGENWEIFDERNHLRYLDRYGKESIEKPYAAFKCDYQKWVEDQKEKEELIQSNEELDRDYLSFQIQEIEKYQVKENEIEDLNAEYEKLRSMAHLTALFDGFEEANACSEGRISDLLSKLMPKLHTFENTPLEEEAKRLLSSLYEVADSFDSFESAYHGLARDPERIDRINERLYQLKSLQRKYGKTTAEILSKYEDFKAKLARMDDFEAELTLLENRIKTDKEKALKSAETLSLARKKAKTEMEKDIGKEMADLSLPKDGFCVRMEKKEMGPTGIDDVSFEIRLNAGLDFAPLKKAASGGESSRLMLSLKILLNALSPFDLLVLDEIDTGVSGETASLMARKIKSVSKTSQILVISHLPQVVASSDTGIQIEKTVRNQNTYTTSHLLNDEEMVMEVAKMISGSTVTESAIRQAKVLIKESHS